MAHFTPMASLFGGLLIGLAAVGLMLFNGRIAGISSILASALVPSEGERPWRWTFLGGLVVGGLASLVFMPGVFETTLERSTGALIVAGLMVGAGTQLGGGCTSGHGVCGIGRRSKRSIAATVTFMATAAVTVFIVANAFGGVL